MGAPAERAAPPALAMQTQFNSSDRLVVAMSGGVDSSAVAWMLREAGHDLVGLFMRNGVNIKESEVSKKSCCSLGDARDARMVAARLDVPFQAMDLKEEFGEVIDYFVSEYGRGRTPNPCAVCNRDLKMGKLMDFADELGCAGVATGHYAASRWRMVVSDCGVASIGRRTSPISCSPSPRRTSCARRRPSATSRSRRCGSSRGRLASGRSRRRTARRSASSPPTITGCSSSSGAWSCTRGESLMSSARTMGRTRAPRTSPSASARPRGGGRVFRCTWSRSTQKRGSWSSAQRPSARRRPWSWRT